MVVLKGLILAGGHGTRLRPLTFTGNKHMIPVANKPMILHGFEHLISAGIKEIGIILGPVSEGVVELLGDGSKFGVKITYIEQLEPKGLAHAVMMAESFLQDAPFTMYLGDNLLRQGIKPMVKMFNQNKSDCVIGVTKIKDPQMYGVVELDNNGNIIRLVEKPREFISDLALIGVYIFNNKIFDAIKTLKPSKRGEFEITDAIQKILDDGAKIDIQFVQGWWKDMGKPDDLLVANQLVLQDLVSYNYGDCEENQTVTGQVGIGKGTLIRSGSVIRGPAIIGNNCKIGPKVFIGPYTSIGDNVTIRNSEVDNSIIMDGVEIDCGKRISDSLIGKDTKVVNSEDKVPRTFKLLLGDASFVSI